MRIRDRLSLAIMAIPALPLVIFVGLLNIIHPLIHGTPLDSGALDGILQQLDLMAAAMAPDLVRMDEHRHEH